MPELRPGRFSRWGWRVTDDDEGIRVEITVAHDGDSYVTELSAYPIVMVNGYETAGARVSKVVDTRDVQWRRDRFLLHAVACLHKLEEGGYDNALSELVDEVSV